MKAQKQIIEVHKNDILAGDTIVIDGIEKTVCKKDINVCQLMGVTIFGDSFKLGRTLVKKVLFPKWNKGDLVGYVGQP